MDVPREIGIRITSDCQFLVADGFHFPDIFRCIGFKTVNDDRKL